MKNKVIKGLVALSLLFAGLAVVNTGSNVDTVQANNCPWWINVPRPECQGGGGNTPGGSGQIPELLPPHMRPANIEIDFTK